MPAHSFLHRSFVRRGLVMAVLGLLLLAAAAVRLLPGASNQTIGQAGEPERQEVLYLAPSRQPELWVMGLDGGKAQQLSNSGGAVYDYAVSPGGARIAYSARNEAGGYDLWEIERRGTGSYGTPDLLLPCGTDWCTGPAYQPDGSRMVYSRRRVSGLAGAQPGIPQLWIFDTSTRQTDLLYVDPNIGGASAAWSPDGRYLAFVDDRSRSVRVADMQGEAEFTIPAGEGADISWTPDSRRLLVVREAAAHEHPYTVLVAFDLPQGQETILLDDPELDSSVPVWSPDGKALAAARRVIHDGPGKQIWLLNPDGSSLRAVTENPRANHAAYHWSPDGAYLLFQRLEFGSSSSVPEVLLWDRQTGETKVLAEDAFLPGWVD